MYRYVTRRLNFFSVETQFIQFVMGLFFRFASPPRSQASDLSAKRRIFVGRVEELCRLRELTRAYVKAERDGGLVLIQGHQGLGKSALLLHYVTSLAATSDGAPLTVWPIQGLDTGVSQPWGAWRTSWFLSLVEAAFLARGLSRRALHLLQDVVPQLDVGLMAQAGGGRGRDDGESNCGEEAEADRAMETIQAICDVMQLGVDALRDLGGGGRALMVIDDCHFLDALSLQAVHNVRARVTPLLLVVGLRPQSGERGAPDAQAAPGSSAVHSGVSAAGHSQHHAPALIFERHDATLQLSLCPFSKEEACELAHLRLASDGSLALDAPLPDDLEAALAAGGGHPLYVCEIILLWRAARRECCEAEGPGCDGPSSSMLRSLVSEGAGGHFIGLAGGCPSGLVHLVQVSHVVVGRARCNPPVIFARITRARTCGACAPLYHLLTTPRSQFRGRSASTLFRWTPGWPSRWPP